MKSWLLLVVSVVFTMNALGSEGSGQKEEVTRHLRGSWCSLEDLGILIGRAPVPPSRTLEYLRTERGNPDSVVYRDSGRFFWDRFHVNLETG